MTTRAGSKMGIVAGFLVWVFSVSVASAQPAEFIPLYEVDITPEPDGTFAVVETIHYDFARYYRHGVTRDIPLGHPQDSSAFYKERYIDITLASTTMDGEPIPVEATKRNDTLALRVGDPVQTVTSEHVFTIPYEVNGALQYFPDTNPELYWDAIGSDSTVVIEEAVIRVHDEYDLLTGTSSCYVGSAGSGDSCGEVVVEENVYTYTVSDLKPQEGVTVAFALDTSVETVILERYNYWYFVVPAAVVILIAFAIWLYRYKTAFRTGRSIIAQYEPYEGFKPMYTGALVDDQLNPEDITACIVYLAEQGYLKIRKTERKVLFFITVDDYKITLRKKVDGQLSRFQEDVLSLLFTDVVEGESVTLSDLKGDLSKQRENQSTLRRLKSDIKKDLADQGFFQSVAWEQVKPYLGFAMGVTVVVFFVFPPIGILLIALALIFFFASRRRTRKGYRALDHLKGFKQFLSVTEKERYAFHNAPEKSPEQFMQYLPYAIAFGVEKEWVKVFKDVTIPDPEWYDSGGAGAFSATNLTHSIGAFSSAFASSAGSSGGGASGGGSVGGGGGGGSVGSW